MRVAMPPGRRRQIEVDPRLIEEAVHRVLQCSLSHDYWAQRKFANETTGRSLRNRRFAEICLDILRALMFHVPLDIACWTTGYCPLLLPTYIAEGGIRISR